MKGCIKTPGLLEASLQLRSSTVGAEAERDGAKLARLLPSGLRRLGRGLGEAAPGEERGASTPSPPPRDSETLPGASAPHLPPRLPPLRPFRSMGSDPRDSQLQALVSRRRHPAPPPSSSSFGLLRPAPPPRLRLYRSPWHGGRSSVQPGPTPLPRPARPASEREAAGDKLSARARARKRRSPERRDVAAADRRSVLVGERRSTKGCAPGPRRKCSARVEEHVEAT